MTTTNPYALVEQLAKALEQLRNASETMSRSMCANHITPLPSFYEAHEVACKAINKANEYLEQPQVEQYVHPISGRTANELWLETGRLRSKIADMKDDAKVSMESIKDVISQHLTSLYVCKRVWEAWAVGTMGKEDFTPVEETEFSADLAASLFSLYIYQQATKPVK